MILITGSSGFIGTSLIKELQHQNIAFRCALRIPAQLQSEWDTFYVGDINNSTEWGPALRDVSVVLHCAARAHIMGEEVTDNMSAYREVNLGGTLNLALQAAVAGVKRFIFISSIKVNGEETYPGYAFKASDKPNPQNAYGISKMEAEQGLEAISRETGMEFVCIRPSLVYGPGVKGNFFSLLRWVERGIPLPFGAVHNQRSLVGIDNLVDLIITCINHPAAANQVFLVSDDEDLSTTELLRRMSIALKKPVRLLPVSSNLLKLGAGILGKKEVIKRLLGDLQVDIFKTKELLNWSPPVSVNDALHKTAVWYLNHL